MSRIGSTLKTSYNVVAWCEHVHDLSFTFIAPLQSQQDINFTFVHCCFIMCVYFYLFFFLFSMLSCLDSLVWHTEHTP